MVELALQENSDRQRKHTLGLATRIGLLAAVMIFVSLGLTLTVVLRQVDGDMRRQGSALLEVNMRLLHSLIADKAAGRAISVADGRLLAGQALLNGDDALVDKVRDIVGGRATIFLGDTRVATNIQTADGHRAVGTKLARGPVYDAVLRDGRPFRGEADILGSRYFTAYDPLLSADGKVAGVLFIGVLKSDFLAIVDGLIRSVIAIGALVGVLGAAVSMAAVWRTLRPLALLRDAMLALARGETTVAVPGLQRQDEIGAMAAAVEEFRYQGVEKRRLEGVVAEEHAIRERQRAAMERYTQDFGYSVSGVLAALGASSVAMRQSTDGMAQAVEMTRSGSAATAAGAEESSRNLADVAAAIADLTASVGEITRQAAQGAELAREAVMRAETTGQRIQGLSEAAGQIGSVVKLIADIAGRTNLLALNATIEAARAGEAGKGFAVVASEVKQLATQTARATSQIAEQIAAIRSATQVATAAMREVGTSITRLDEVASSIAVAVEEQGAATRKIATNVQTVTRQNEGATGRMRELAQVAEDTSGSSRGVLSAVDNISHVASTLKGEVDDFLAAMRAQKADLRRWERVPGGQARVLLTPRGGARVEGHLADISRGGASIVCSLVLEAGAELKVEMAASGGAIAARVVRRASDSLSVAFRQDPETLAQVDQALAAVRDATEPPGTAQLLA
jgi:methyl-accepting chemotaxis protein